MQPSGLKVQDALQHEQLGSGNLHIAYNILQPSLIHHRLKGSNTIFKDHDGTKLALTNPFHESKLLALWDHPGCPNLLCKSGSDTKFAFQEFQYRDQHKN